MTMTAELAQGSDTAAHWYAAIEAAGLKTVAREGEP